MQVKQINTDKKNDIIISHRPTNFDDFVGQFHVKKILKTAIKSASHRKQSIGHILISGPSGYGKTTLAQIIANQAECKIHIITGYAISKPADIISILTMIQKNDILFIDEIHRLKPIIEEILYIAMEDYAIDMVMPDGGSVRVPLKPFTLVGATTKPDGLSEPLKNRFIYNCQFVDYNTEEKTEIVKRYLLKHDIKADNIIIERITNKVDTVPREIHNLCIKIRDYLISHNNANLELNHTIWLLCEDWLQIKDGGITPIHQQYMTILSKQKSPLGLRTIALQLGINEETVEKEIEPLLIKLDIIEKSSRGRSLK